MISEEATRALHITLFGPPTVRLHGAPLRPLRSRTGEWLLALLVLRQGREVERNRLAGLLWPESREEQALGNLRRTLTDLRQALGDQAERIAAPDPHTLILALQEEEADVLAFDAALRRGDPASLERAIGLYRGPLLENCLESWALEAREARHQDYLNALEKLAAHAFSAQEGSAIGLLRRLIAADPYRESAHRVLMQALAQDGAIAAVTGVYRDLRLLLRRELNADPDPETRTVYQRLHLEARQRATHAEVPSEEREKRETRRPASHPVTGRLPQPLTSLVGRQRESGAVGELLIRERLVTLTGTGGLGKTRLALQVAAEQADRFPEGVWFVGLAALTDGERVPVAVAAGLGLREESGTPLMETLAAYLGSRSLLLLLDNCEHVLQGVASLCAALLPECGDLHILATSRQATGVLGEVIWRVPPLALPEQGSTFPMLQKCESVRLFVERAEAVHPRFTLTQQNTPAVIEICRRLEGLPLALELAAARARMLSVEQIAERLKDRFRLLSGGNPTALPRHQTLRGCLEWSYDLLPEEERLLLGRISVFAGSFTLDAAEAVTKDALGMRADESNPPSSFIEEWEVLDLLTSLADKSLLSPETHPGEMRYALLETIRQFAHEKLILAEERERPQRLHRDYYLSFAGQADDSLNGPEQLTWLHRIDIEYDNLREALAFCREDLDSAAQGLSLCANLWVYWEIHGSCQEGREWCESMLAHPHASEFKMERADTLNGLAVLTSKQDNRAARAIYEEALALQRELGNEGGIGTALNNLGNTAWALGDFDEAFALYSECLQIVRARNHKGGIIISLSNLGNVAYERKDYAQAQSFYTEALELNREFASPDLHAKLLGNLGNVARDQQDFAQAQALNRASLEIFSTIGDRMGMAQCLDSLASIARAQSLPERAARLYGYNALFREAIGFPVLPIYQRELDENTAALRSSLGREKFEALYKEARTMSYEEAVAFALND